MDPAVRALARDHLPGGITTAAPDPEVAAALRAEGMDVVTGPLAMLGDDDTDALALLADELSRAGPHAEGVVAEAARVLRPGGLLLVSAVNRIHAAATGRLPAHLRGYTAAELERLLGHGGFARELLAAPGAASGLAGRPPAWQPELDRQPGLLDAGPRLVAVARAPASPSDRSEVFFATLPRKVTAAAVVCRDDEDRLLIVHDSFKDWWTVPGGVVDADEGLRAAAAREAWEEAGVRVEVGRLLGVFTASWPDRIAFLFAARSRDATPPAPVHDHEIDDVAWLPADAALARLAPPIAAQVRRGLRHPGEVWHDAPAGA